MWAFFDFLLRCVMVCSVAALFVAVRMSWRDFSREYDKRHALTVLDVVGVDQVLGRCQACNAPTAFRFCIGCACWRCGELADRKSSVAVATCRRCARGGAHV